MIHVFKKIHLRALANNGPGRALELQVWQDLGNHKTTRYKRMKN